MRDFADVRTQLRLCKCSFRAAITTRKRLPSEACHSFNNFCGHVMGAIFTCAVNFVVHTLEKLYRGTVHSCQLAAALTVTYTISTARRTSCNISNVGVRARNTASAVQSTYYLHELERGMRRNTNDLYSFTCCSCTNFVCTILSDHNRPSKRWSL